ncbi:hypothetical protein ACRALDRAFT_1069390 [Sodiomyces alcalophilus JCM 7366]|uniref:uncharacterized protein n=1 Tax=Sodiomyces alcalophilus JCM 7366 TaxID=591952 RepID=UPI0039B576FE
MKSAALGWGSGRYRLVAERGRVTCSSFRSLIIEQAPKKNDAVPKKAATKKTAIKAGRVIKPVKKNTYKAAKDTANTAAASDTAADTATTAVTPDATAKGSGSLAAAPKERYSAKNPPPDFIGEKFNTPCGHKYYLYFLTGYALPYGFLRIYLNTPSIRNIVDKN